MSKHKYIESPQRMWELFTQYAQSVKDNPRYRTVFVGKNGEEKREPLERPLTMEGFENWCSHHQIIEDLGQYFENREGRYTEYVAICSRVRKCIRQDQIEGGMVGQYNASITQRLNNLIERHDNRVHIEQPLFNDNL